MALFVGINLIIKLLIFYNTTSFQVSEAGSNYSFLNAIESGKNPGLFYESYRSILAYIGYFFKKTTGTLDAFFWFHALIATISVYVLYRICIRLTSKRTSALFAVLLATILMDYHLLTPVFYYQIFEIFFLLLVVYLGLVLIEGNNLMGSAAVLFIPAIIYFSMFFRGTLRYFQILLIGLSLFLIWKKRYRPAGGLAAVAIITIGLFYLLPLDNYREKGSPTVNDFQFFGHTMYGGDGGEGAFIYKENEIRYQHRLKEFMAVRQYETLTVQVRNEFQNREIKEFIIQTPLKWFYLQVRKVALTFGIVPIRDSLEILATGKMSMKWYLGAFIIQIPYAMIIVAFVALTVLFFRISDLADARILFIFLVLFYLIAATCLYGHYQERYRHVVILAGMIPFMSVYFGRLFDRHARTALSSKRKAFLVFIFIVLILHWGYQAYSVLEVHRDRYVKALEQF